MKYLFFSLLYRFKITTFFKITRFQNHIISKSHDFKITSFQNHIISKSRDFKITLFQNHTISKSHHFKNHAISKSHHFKITRFQNHIISKITSFSKSRDFLAFLTIFKTSVFFKISPFKVHFGIPLLKICKKSRFSVQDLGFRLGNMFQTHNRSVIDRVSILFFKNLSKIRVYLHSIKFQKKRST